MNDNRPEAEKVVKLVNTHYTAALNFNNYHVQKQSQVTIATYWAKWLTRLKMDVQMKAVGFRPSDPIFVLSFLDNVKNDCGRNSIHEGAAILLFPHFITKPSKAGLSQRVTAHRINHQ